MSVYPFRQWNRPGKQHADLCGAQLNKRLLSRAGNIMDACRNSHNARLTKLCPVMQGTGIWQMPLHAGASVHSWIGGAVMALRARFGRR
jgi:hypothetical protein